MRALVVFHDLGITHWLARFMKPGFKHCFVAVEADAHWVTLDGRAGLTVVEIVAPADYDLAAFYRSRGYAVIETEQRGRVPLSPFLPRNCVGLVKGVLAIGAMLVLTPWQLYTHLARAESPGFQLLPGESDSAPGRPGDSGGGIKGKSKGLIGDRKAGLESHKTGGPGQAWEGPGAHRPGGGGVEIERRRKASFKDPDADQRDSKLVDLKSGASSGDQSGQLGEGGSAPRKADKGEERRGGRAATLLSASEGIRDKLGRSGRRLPGKSLG